MNILLTSVGNMASPLIQTVLKTKYSDINLTGSDSNRFAHGFKFCDDYFVSPSLKDENILQFFSYIIEKKKISVIYPLSTRDVLFFSLHSEFLNSKGVKIISNNFISAQICESKLRTYEALGNERFVPHFELFIETKQLDDRLKAEQVSVLKHASGSGATGLIITGEINAVNKEDRKWFVPRKDLESILRNEIKSSRLLMPYLNGREFSVDILAQNGNIICTATRERLAGIGGSSLVSKSVEIQELDNLSEVVARKLNLNYINNLQFRQDKSGNYFLLEINPRIPGGIPLSIAAGCDLISNSLAIALGEPLEFCKEYTVGLTMTRFWSEVIL